MTGWEGVSFLGIEANGIRFEVACMEPEADTVTAGKTHRLALCLHGFPEHACSWRHQMPLLARLGYRVWAPNLRGYGNTDAPTGMAAYTLDILIADVVGLIRASGAAEVLLLAHDWGGMLAWMVAVRHPELLTQLIVCNMPHPACFAREVRKPEQARRSWYVLLFQIPFLPERLLRARHAEPVKEIIRRSLREPESIPDEVLETYRSNADRPGRLTAMLHWYRALLRGGGWRSLPKPHEWPVISTPTLLLWGDADAALSVRTTDGTAAFVSDLTLTILPGVSHWVQQEAPGVVNAAIENWLARY